MCRRLHVLIEGGKFLIITLMAVAVAETVLVVLSWHLLVRWLALSMLLIVFQGML